MPLLSGDNVGARRRGDGVGAGGAALSGDGKETTGMPRGDRKRTDVGKALLDWS